MLLVEKRAGESPSFFFKSKMKMTEEKFHQIIEVNFPVIGVDVQVLADTKRGYASITHVTYVPDNGQNAALVELSAPLRIDGRDIIGEGLPLSLISPDAGSEPFNLIREIEPPANGNGSRFECKLKNTSLVPGATSGRFILTMEK